ncbi:MAG: hypothetical protein RIG77_17885 [Cyclobacteriaceae bacterium]
MKTKNRLKVFEEPELVFEDWEMIRKTVSQSKEFEDKKEILSELERVVTLFKSRKSIISEVELNEERISKILACLPPRPTAREIAGLADNDNKQLEIAQVESVKSKLEKLKIGLIEFESKLID